MGTINRFEELECWQEAREFVQMIYRLTRNDHFKKDFDLVKQMRRSAVSSMANIAEGFHRNSPKDFMRFLNYSRSSIAETISHSYVAFDQNYIDANNVEQIKEKAEGIWKKINAFISYLNKYSQSNK
jgi:four helix bundle protein